MILKQNFVFPMKVARLFVAIKSETKSEQYQNHLDSVGFFFGGGPNDSSPVGEYSKKKMATGMRK